MRRQLVFGISRSQLSRYPAFIAAVAVALCLTVSATADTIAIANRTKDKVAFTLMPLDAKAESRQIASGEVLALPVIGQASIAFQSPVERRQYQLDPNCAYHFVLDGREQVDLQKIPLNEGDRTAAGTGIATQDSLTQVAKIPVKVLVDEDEAATRQVWEPRLRRRIENVSAILEKTCRLRLEVVAFEEWRTDNRIKDFEKSLVEFEQEVRPGNARIAIGFTSQYELPKGRTHLGGTRGSFHSHILIREWSQHITESERLEVLLHELGHVLGASHSAEPGSVMRPQLGDRKARLTSFRIQFDPANVIALNLMADEIRLRAARKVADLSPATMTRLREIYAALEQTLPKDPAAKNYQELLDRQTLATLATHVRRVVTSVTQAAEANAKLPLAAPRDQEPAADKINAPDPIAASETRRSGDALTSYYIRQAAWAASQAPPDDAPAAFLIGLGIALDDSGFMLKHPILKGFVTAVEDDSQRARRQQIIGDATVHGRSDLVKHFLVSGYLAVLLGSRGAEAAGVAKELHDMEKTSGFSFADMAANRAGMLFALSLVAKKITLMHVATDFSVEFYIPSVTGLPEGLNADAFAEQFGSTSDERYRQVIADIDTRLRALPPYRRTLTTPMEIEKKTTAKPAKK